MADTAPTHLIDYFAGQALTGLIARMGSPAFPRIPDEELVERAYEIAGAMVKESGKHGPRHRMGPA